MHTCIQIASHLQLLIVLLTTQPSQNQLMVSFVFKGMFLTTTFIASRSTVVFLKYTQGRFKMTTCTRDSGGGQWKINKMNVKSLQTTSLYYSITKSILEVLINFRKVKKSKHKICMFYLLSFFLSFTPSFIRETLTENRGPNAVSVVHLKGYWSTNQLRPDRFSTHEMFLSF